MNERCAGTGGVYRMDKAEVQEFLCDFSGLGCP